MKKVFVVGQPKFGYDPNEIETRKEFWSDANMMNSDLISKWNDVVGEDSKIYVVGNLFHSSLDVDARTEILSRLNGNIQVIKHKHDVETEGVQMVNSSKIIHSGMLVSIERFDEIDFNQQVSYSIISNDSRLIDKLNRDHIYYIYQECVIRRNHLHFPIFNVCVDFWKFTPVDIDIINTHYRRMF